MGEVLTHWTIRLALVCLAARLAGQLHWGNALPWFRWSRVIWTIGCVFFLLHVACAFHFYHDWSHAKALASTAEKTHALLGVRFGEGIYFSYLFALLWIGDVLWQWVWPLSYRQRLPWLAASVLGYMAFIAFNGAVVFEGGVTRWVGIPVTLGLLIAACALLARDCRTGLPAHPNESGDPSYDRP
jgi:hypothetical protein